MLIIEHTWIPLILDVAGFFKYFREFGILAVIFQSSVLTLLIQLDRTIRGTYSVGSPPMGGGRILQRWCR
jgi:hypothetical protein